MVVVAIWLYGIVAILIFFWAVTDIRRELIDHRPGDELQSIVVAAWMAIPWPLWLAVGCVYGGVMTLALIVGWWRGKQAERRGA